MNLEGLPARKGVGVRIFYKKVIVLLGIILFSLTTFLAPTETYRAIGLVPSYSDLNTTRVIKTDLERKATIDIVNNYIKELEEQGYKNVSYELSVFYQLTNDAYIQLPTKYTIGLAGIEDKIINSYEYYADYVIMTIDDNIYYFKTIEELETFKKELQQYDKTQYQEGVSKQLINRETEKETLNNLITQRKNKAEAAARAKKVSRAKTKKTSVKVAKAAAKEKQQKNVKISNAGGIAYGNAIVKYAIQFNGNPYIWGGTSLTKGADCSGFVQSIFKHFGVHLPRGARAQSKTGKLISYKNIQPGDLIFYGKNSSAIFHVALYIGGNKVIHAQTPSRGIGITASQGGSLRIAVIRRVI